MDTFHPALAVLQTSEGGSLFGTMLDALPTDPASLFILALVVALAGAVIFYGTRGGSDEAPKGP